MCDPSGQYFLHEEDLRIFVDFHFGHLLQIGGFLQDQGTGIEFQKRTIPDPKLLLNPGNPGSHKMRTGSSRGGHYHRGLVGHFNITKHSIPSQ